MPCHANFPLSVANVTRRCIWIPDTITKDDIMFAERATLQELSPPKGRVIDPPVLTRDHPHAQVQTVRVSHVNDDDYLDRMNKRGLLNGGGAVVPCHYTGWACLAHWRALCQCPVARAGRGEICCLLRLKPW